MRGLELNVGDFELNVGDFDKKREIFSGDRGMPRFGRFMDQSWRGFDQIGP